MKSHFNFSTIPIAVFFVALLTLSCGEAFELQKIKTIDPVLEGGIVSEIEYSHDGKYLMAAVNQDIGVWTTESYIRYETLSIDSGIVVKLEFSADGRYLASANRYGKTFLWDVGTFSIVRQTETYHDIGGLAISPDAKYLAAASHVDTSRQIDDSKMQVENYIVKIKVWDIEDKIELVTEIVNPVQSGIVSIKFSPDGRYLMLAGAKIPITFYSTTDWSEAKTVGSSGCVAAAFSPDGGRIAVAKEELAKSWVEVYDVESGNSLKILSTGAGETAACVAFSPSGKYLIVGGELERGARYSGKVKIYDTAEYKLIREDEAHKSSITQVVFSPDSHSFATKSGKLDNLIIVWKITDQDSEVN